MRITVGTTAFSTLICDCQRARQRGSPARFPFLSIFIDSWFPSMKVTIIGGGGRVRSSAAFSLQWGGLVSEIQLPDANKDPAQGEALELCHGSPFPGDHTICTGDYKP